MTKQDWEKRLIKQIKSFLYCWYGSIGKEEKYQKMAEELYWKAIHEELKRRRK